MKNKLAMALGIFFLANSLQAGVVYYVSPTGLDTNSGLTQELALATIPAAITKCNAANGDEVNVLPGYYAVGATINLNKAIRVKAVSDNPRETVLDGLHQRGVLVVNNGSSTFAGFTVSNGIASASWAGNCRGGGITFLTGGVVSNCVVTCNEGVPHTSYGRGGGGVYMDEAGGFLVDCEISLNTAPTGNGGGVYLYGSNTVVGCRVFNNSCALTGGGICVASGRKGSTVVGTVISNNLSVTTGGGVYISLAGAIAFKDCSIIRNASQGNLGGGGVYSSGATVFDGCLFDSNSKALQGSTGGAAFYSTGANDRFVGCVVTNHQVAQAVQGGAFYFNNGTAFISNTVFACNGTGSNGGAIKFNTAGSIVSGCRFVGNAAGWAGAVHGGASFSDCAFEGNRATNAPSGTGGAVSFDGVMSFDRCTFVNNRSTSHGGAIYSNAGGVIIRNCRYESNVAGDYAGAVYAGIGATISDTEFVNNQAKDGGALAPTFGNLNRCLFTGNLATNTTVGYNCGGGAIRVDSVATGTVVSCSFINNTALYIGGAVLMNSGCAAVTNCIFEGNEAGYVAGGFTASDGYYHTTDVKWLSFYGCAFTGNRTSRTGGGLKFWRPVEWAEVKNCLFVGNVCTSNDWDGACAGLYAGGTNVVVQSSTIVANTNENYTGGEAGAGVKLSIAATMINCIVASNAIPKSSSAYKNVKRDSNTDIRYCCDTENQLAKLHASNLFADPFFADAGAGNFRLQRRSPCVNAGLVQSWMDKPATDLAGNPRLWDSKVDIGAYELNYLLSTLLKFY